MVGRRHLPRLKFCNTTHQHTQAILMRSPCDDTFVPNISCRQGFEHLAPLHRCSFWSFMNSPRVSHKEACPDLQSRRGACVLQVPRRIVYGPRRRQSAEQHLSSPLRCVRVWERSHVSIFHMILRLVGEFAPSPALLERACPGVLQCMVCG